MTEPLVRFTIPGRPANLGNARMHWAERARVVKDQRAVAKIIGNAARARAGLGPAEGPRRLVLTLILAGQGRDSDNATASIKGFADGLEDCGLIKSDSPEWCQLEVRQRKTRFRDQQGVMVEVYEVGGDE